MRLWPEVKQPRAEKVSFTYLLVCLFEDFEARPLRSQHCAVSVSVACNFRGI